MSLVDRLEVLGCHVGVDLRRGDAGMAQELLNHPKVRAMGEQVRGKAVAKHVRGHMPFNPSPQNRLGDALPERHMGEGGSPLCEKHHARTFRPDQGVPDC